MILFTSVLLFLCGVALQAPADALSMTSLPLSSLTRMVHACSYSEQLSSIQISHEGMPCNSLYTNSSLQAGFLTKFNASFVESFSVLQPLTGVRCFKLEMVTSCTQKWFTSNEISRYYNVLTATRQDCLAAGTCRNCEVSGQYLPEVCQVSTFGPNEVKRTVVYTKDVVVYQNKVGQAFYAGITTTSQDISVGGTFSEMVFFTFADKDDSQIGMFSVNPFSLAVISYDMRRILTNTNITVQYRGDDYYVYEQNHLIHKKTVDEQAARGKAQGRQYTNG